MGTGRREWIAACTVVLLGLAAVERVGAWPTAFIPVRVKEDYARTWGLNPARERTAFAVNDLLQVYLVTSSVPANILWPGDSARFTFQFRNLTDRPIATNAVARLVQYQVITHPGDDVFDIGLAPVREIARLNVPLAVAPKGWQDVEVAPDIPAVFGGYALVFDLAGHDSLFGATCVRTFKPEVRERRFYRLCMDLPEIPALRRLGAAPNRVGFSYKPTTDADFEEWYTNQTAYLRDLKAAGLPVCIEFGGGAPNHPAQPLGRARPWLDAGGTMQETKSDYAWLPAYDADFKKLVKRLLAEFGWPRGPVNAVKLWNEPWEGISISGWGADMLRYREMFRALGEARDESAAESGVQVLVGGCDSSANTCDKLFPDGSDEFLKWLDFLSIHYQGTDPGTTVKRWVDRKDAQGRPARVLVWDTESWVANSDDRIAGVLAAMLSFGQDRVVGIQSDVVVEAVQRPEVLTAAGRERRKILQAWAPAAAVGAFQHFVGERPFRELLFTNGLPVVMVFDAEPDTKGRTDPEDGTVVVLGDPGSVFGPDGVAFRTCRSLAEVADKEALRVQLSALPEGDTNREALVARLAKPQPYRDAVLKVEASDAYGLYDFYGNPVPAEAGHIKVPLDARGFYLRGNGQPGSMAALLAALRQGRIQGLEPLAVQCGDLTARPGARAAFRLRLTNVRNQPVAGTLALTLAEAVLEYPHELILAPQETRDVWVKVVSGAEKADNVYPLHLDYQAGESGFVIHDEALHANVIQRRSIHIDGDLADWKGALPHPIRMAGAATATLTEKAWLPFMPFDESVKKGFALAYLAYDASNLYVAVKATDTTPDGGTLRFETRDDDAFFYPPVAYVAAKDTGESATNFSVRWTGTVQALGAGDYTVSLALGSGGARLRLDGKTVIDDWAVRGTRKTAAVPLTLKAGQAVALTLEYRHDRGPGGLTLGWQAPGMAFSAIHGDRFTTPEGKRGIRGEYFEGTGFERPVQVRVDPSVNFGAWPGHPGDADFAGPRRTGLAWPDGVRRYSYRQRPILPCGSAPAFDNVQLALNVLPPEAKEVYPCPPGTLPGYIMGRCTDYEYALNRVASRYGGGVEVWRLRKPGMPLKNFYPRQPASPLDGPVREARLAVTHRDGTRITECALPWSEIPEARQRLEAHQPIKVSLRINDSAGGGCLELARGRSVSKRQSSAFSVPWVEHWANEVEFTFEP